MNWKLRILQTAAVAAVVTGVLLGVWAKYRTRPAPCGQQPCGDPAASTAAAALKSHYMDQGYFWAQADPELLTDGKHRFTVTLGDLYRFDKLTILGASDDWIGRVSGSLPLKKGDIYRPSLARAWLDSVERPAANSLYAQYRPKKFEVDFDRERHLISLVLEVSKAE